MVLCEDMYVVICIKFNIMHIPEEEALKHNIFHQKSTGL